MNKIFIIQIKYLYSQIQIINKNKMKKRITMILTIALLTIGCNKKMECNKFYDKAVETERLLSLAINGNGPSHLYNNDGNAIDQYGPGKYQTISFKNYTDSLLKSKAESFMLFDACIEKYN